MGMRQLPNGRGRRRTQVFLDAAGIAASGGRAGRLLQHAERRLHQPSQTSGHQSQRRGATPRPITKTLRPWLLEIAFGERVFCIGLPFSSTPGARSSGIPRQKLSVNRRGEGVFQKTGVPIAVGHDNPAGMV